MWNIILYKYIYSRLRNKELTEDIVQDVFIKAWSYRESFDSKKSSLKNWLFIIAINLLKDFYKKKKINTEELNETISSSISDENDIEKNTETNDLIKFVFEKIKLLSEKEQNILFLRYKTDLKIHEIAEITNMNNSAVKVAIHRAIKKLQDFCNEKM